MHRKLFVFFGLLSTLHAAGQQGKSQIDSLVNTLNDTTTIVRSDNASQAHTMMDKKWNHFKTKYFTLNFGLAILLDHNRMNQDENNVEQVGEVLPSTEFRGDRFIFSGELLFFKNHPIKYMASVNFNGLDAPQGKKSFDFVDWNIEVPINKKLGWVTIGKQKEGVGLEYISPGTQMSYMERATGSPMFIRQRNIGIRYSNSIMGQRLTYTIGYFNNYWETGKSASANGSQFITRVSGLPYYKSDAELLHLGIGYRHSQPTDGKLSYKAKPEFNTAPSYINTGSFEAIGAGTLTMELMLVKESFSFLSEVMRTSVNSNVSGDPTFNYWQIGGSYFITGEHRRYNKITGNPGKLIPNKNFKFRKGTGPGAWELASRFTSTNGTDAGIAGGKFTRFTTAVSWYPNAHFRYSINYGFGRLEKGGLIGTTNMWQFRAQFEL
jgi:phosphate-selective porin OprO/OprP